MTTQTIHTVGCTPTRRVTGTLLGYGAIAGPVYVGVSLAQGVTRDGFDLTRHQWSMLSNGSLGWIQVTNFVLTGLMMIAMGLGARRALARGRGATWAPRLIAVFGASFLVAAAFKADPAFGFPVGTPEGAAAISTSGLVHFTAAGIGFTCAAVACFAMARRYAVEGRLGWARYSRATGVVFLAGFAAVASGGGSSAANLAFTAAVILVFAWTTAVSLELYRHASAAPATDPR